MLHSKGSRQPNSLRQRPQVHGVAAHSSSPPTAAGVLMLLQQVQGVAVLGGEEAPGP
jgi:hypothetical protein